MPNPLETNHTVSDLSKAGASPRAGIGRRIFDIVVAFTAIFLVGPLLCFVALAIRLESRGPILFRSRRIGRWGHDIFLLKFRTMYMNAESSEIREYKIDADPRITRVGRFLRKTSLDELPQLLNVLTGDLSFIGPRAALPAEYQLYVGAASERFSVRPGLTGLWQVSGYPRQDFNSMIELDRMYVEHRNIWMDCKILWLTIVMTTTGRSAY